MTGIGRPKPPPVKELNGWQYLGWHCCWCDKALRVGARSVGRAEGRSGAHDLSIEVYECAQPCPERPAEIEPE